MKDSVVKSIQNSCVEKLLWNNRKSSIKILVQRGSSSTSTSVADHKCALDLKIFNQQMYLMVQNTLQDNVLNSYPAQSSDSRFWPES